MYPEDIEALYPKVPVGTPVRLINEPVKVARLDGQVWLEVHPPVDAEGQTVTPHLPTFEARLDTVLGESEAVVNWEIAQAALLAANGLPVMVGLELLPESDPLQNGGDAPSAAPESSVATAPPASSSGD